MIIWVVRAWDNYYPLSDNTVGHYLNKEDAIKRYNEVRDSNKYDQCEYQPEEVMSSYDIQS